MSKTEASVFVQLLVMESEDQGLGRTFDEADASNMGFSAEVLYQRLSWAKVEISRAVAAWITYNSVSPGHLVLWAWTLRSMYYRPLSDKNPSAQHSGPLTPISLENWAVEFPTGLPTSSHYDRIWDAQKSSGYNLLDLRSTWVSPSPAQKAG